MASNTPVPIPAGLLSKVTVKVGSGAKVPGPASVPVVPAKGDLINDALTGAIGGLTPAAYASILDVPNPAKAKPVPPPAIVPLTGPNAGIPATKPAKVPKPKHTPKVHGSDLVPVPAAGVPGLDLVSAVGGTLFPIVLPEQLAGKIAKPITGSGGWQRVMADLQAALTHDAAGDLLVPVLKLTPHMLDRITTLSVKHGGGGYQAVMRWIVCLAMDQHKSKLLKGVA